MQTAELADSHPLKRELRLRDLVQMQILLVVGVTWIGIVARQGETHVVFWLAAILTFIPSAWRSTWPVRLSTSTLASPTSRPV